MALWRQGISAATYRRITLGALVALIFIIVTGGAVRLTGSGLGCSDWTTCEENQFLPDVEYHALVESVNRAITGVVSVAVALAVLGSLLLRPRRRHLIGLALGLVAGVAGQVVLGGLVVWYHLSPWLVISHFLLSMVLVANAVVLHHRAGRLAASGGRDGPAPYGPAPYDPAAYDPAAYGGGPSRVTANLTPRLLAVTVVGIVDGTLLTGAGPHGGDADVERLDYDIPSLARFHGGAMALCAAMALALWAGAERGTFGRRRRGRRPAGHAGAARAVVLVIGAQAAIGYLQYFTGVPALLVGIHIAGAALLWTAVLRLHLAVAEVHAR
ncbi:MAG: heme A synthase [Acidimicrobiia bacterium]|nr:heme A synthase [Acidimicrobiia bacterium]